MSEITPGLADRRYTPEGGLQKHRERIHKESKQASDKLPFTFSKLRRGNTPTTLYECEECGSQFLSNKNTFMVICRTCKAVKKVVEV